MKDVFKKFNDDYPKIAEYCKKNNCEKQSKSNGWSKFSKVRSFIDFAIEEEALTKNLLRSRKYNKKYIESNFKDPAKGKPFNKTELNNFFNRSSWFNEKDTKKTIKQQPERYFIPLLGLFCGMRLNEISALRIKDIKQDEDTKIWYIDLTAHEDRRLKTVKSKRAIPLNNVLLHKLGFLNFIKSIEDKDRLFWNLTLHKKNGYGHNLSKAFNNPNFKKEWISDDRLNDKSIKLDFHSFRHTFITRLHEAGVEESIINFLTGHEQKTESQQTYTQANIKILKKAVDKINVKDIDFDIIKKAVNDLF
jgi:integrase